MTTISEEDAQKVQHLYEALAVCLSEHPSTPPVVGLALLKHLANVLRFGRDIGVYKDTEHAIHHTAGYPQENIELADRTNRESMN
jgi:hypothetical protein